MVQKILLVMVVTAYATINAAIPELFQICYRDDPNINACLKNSIQEAYKALEKGIPEYNVPQFQPFYTKDMKIEYKNGLFVGRADVENVYTSSYSTPKVENVRANLQDNFMDLEIDWSNHLVNIVGYFKGEVGFDNFLLHTKSSFNNTLTNLKFTWKLHGEPKLINGKTHMKIKSFHMRPVVGNMVMVMPNIFENSPDLARTVQNLVFAYWRDIYQVLLPGMEKYWEKWGTRMSNRIFKNIPYDELFPKSSKV